VDNSRMRRGSLPAADAAGATSLLVDPGSRFVGGPVTVRPVCAENSDSAILVMKAAENRT
jgi:hypothetical protein